MPVLEACPWPLHWWPQHLWRGRRGPSIQGRQKGRFIFYVRVIMILIIIHVATHNASKNSPTLKLDLIALFFMGAFSKICQLLFRN